MPRLTSGKRYAQAAFELALEKNELESWREALEKIASLTREKELVAMLEDPRIPFDAKRSILLGAMGAIHPLALNLVLLLVSKGRLGVARDIYRHYLRLLDAHRGVERAKVTTAVPLSEEDYELISRRLEGMVKQKVVIDADVDASIIGGFIARIGDRLIDGSIRQNLERLKRTLVEAGR